MQAWTRPGSIIITEVIEYPQEKQLYFFICGGDLATVEAMTPEVYAWGKSLGCTVAVFAGRPGWQRTFLARQGWQVKPFIIMEKAL